MRRLMVCPLGQVKFITYSYQVAIKLNRGNYIGQGAFDHAKQRHVADEMEMLTPVKNKDGSWPFKSRGKKYLSSWRSDSKQRDYVDFQKHNKRCEKWTLERY